MTDDELWPRVPEVVIALLSTTASEERHMGVDDVLDGLTVLEAMRVFHGAALVLADALTAAGPLPAEQIEKYRLDERFRDITDGLESS